MATMKFIMKWLLNGVIVVCLLMMYADVSFIHAAITATALTLIAYVIGDQLILRATNNAFATITDAVLAYLLLWVAADSMNWDLSTGETLVIVAILGIAEWVLHRYVFNSRLSVA